VLTSKSYQLLPPPASCLHKSSPRCSYKIGDQCSTTQVQSPTKASLEHSSHTTSSAIMKSQFFATLLATSLATASAGPTEAGPAAVSAPPGTSLRSITHSGSGCGITSALIVGDWVAISLNAETNAKTGPGVPSSDARKNCQFGLDIGFPSGWQAAIRLVEYSGYASLGGDMSGQGRGTGWFGGQGTDLVSPSCNAW